MNKNFKVVQLQGLSGLLILGFIATGLFCGFIIFPIWIIMNLWNTVVAEIHRGPIINYFQALLLWMAVALMFYVVLKNNISIKIQKEEIECRDIRDLVGEFKEETEEIKNIAEKEESKK